METMASDARVEQVAWTSLERGPTQNAAYVIGGTFVAAALIGLISRAFKGLPFDLALLTGLAKFTLPVIIFTVFMTIYLKSWRIRYNALEITTSKLVILKRSSSSYLISDLRSMGCYFSRSVTMFGLPFDTLVFQFTGSALSLRTSDWERESLKQFIRDLMSYSRGVPVEQKLLNYIAGEYDDIFVKPSESRSSRRGYADGPSL
jgi:hypothetical protein